MTIPNLLKLGLLLVGLILTELGRPIVRRRLGARLRCTEREASTPEARQSVYRDHLPDHLTLAGVPLRILLSERSGAGALLRDMAMSRPPPRDQ